MARRSCLKCEGLTRAVTSLKKEVAMTIVYICWYSIVSQPKSNTCLLKKILIEVNMKSKVHRYCKNRF